MSKVAEGIKPILNNILVELVKEDNTLIKGPAGDIIRTQSKDAEQYCKIIAVGPQVQDVKVGDYVLTRPGKAYDAFDVEGKMYSFLVNFDIISVLAPEVVEYFRNSKAKKFNYAQPSDVN
jgi:co-chaperonin GroES (HSP10)